MDIKNTTNQHVVTPNTGKPLIPNPFPGSQPPSKPLIPLSPSEQSPGNPESSVQGTPADGAFAELEASLEEIRAGEMILNAALAREAELEKYQKKEDRAELESTKEPDRSSSADDAANERIMNRKLLEMLHWKQDSRQSIAANLSQIQSIFQSLLNELLSDYRGTLQLQLLAQLDAFTLNAIRQLVTERFQELLDFLGQYGRPNSNEALINGLFENMSERKPLTLSEGNSAFGGTGYASQNMTQKSTGQQLAQGIIYQKDSKARINTEYQNHVGKLERSGTKALEVIQRGGYLTGSKAYNLRDIRQIQNFVHYLNQNLPQIKSEKLPYTSEEYLGFSAGVSSLKAQTFIEQTGLSEGTASALKYAMGTFAQEYFLQNGQNLKQTPEFQDKSSCPAYQADSFQKIYRYMIDTYNQKHDAQTAVLAGLKKSLESYYEKQTDPVYQNMNRYRSDIGFFSRTPTSDWKNEIINGWKSICKDWNEFLQYTQLSKNKAIKFDYTLSRDYYMSFLMSQEKSPHHGKGRKKKTLQFVLRLGILVIGIIICLFLMALFTP